MSPITPQQNPPSRGFYGYSLDALAGVLSAFILGYAIAHAATVLILLAYLAAVPLFLAGLGAGFVSGFVAVLCGTVGLFLTAPCEVALFYTIADALPALILIYIATRPRAAEGALIAALVIYPCVIFLGIYALTMHDDGGLLKITQDAFDGVKDQAVKMLAENSQQVTPDMAVKLHRYLDTMAHVAPALGMCAWLFSTLIALVLSQSFLCGQQWNLRPAFTLAALRVPKFLLLLAFAGIAAAAEAPAPYDYIALNLAFVLCVPFFLVGLAVVHALVAGMRYATTLLVVFYIVLTFIINFAPFVAALGAVDEIVDIRKRLADKKLSKII